MKSIPVGLLILTGVMCMHAVSLPRVYADWWVRPTERERDFSRPSPFPTSPREWVDPATSTPDPGTPSPTNTPADSGDTTNTGGTPDDPCRPGQSYVGPYCGWSPDVDQPRGTGSSGGGSSSGPAVLGLSNTSSQRVNHSDIILLFGVLCLLLYIRSKIITRID